MRFSWTLGLVASCAAALTMMPAAAQPPAGPDAAKETRLRNVRQLTFGGENAEAYFSADGSRIIFQSTREGVPCDQIFTMNIDGGDLRRVSTGKGRTTCGFFLPGGDEFVYASTHDVSPECPPRPDMSRGYVWPIYDYDIYRARADGSGLTNLTRSAGYDAEPTVAPDGTIVFTSTRDGDMEIYSMNADGSGVKRLTNRPGPDGGPFFSHDGHMIAWRGRQMEPGPALEEYRALLQKALWRPGELEIFIMNRDGSDQRQVTKLGGANFAPSWHPDRKRLIFSSNMADPKGREFELYLINIDGTGLERVTHNALFDGFPMFSPDGRRLVFASNRHGKVEGETNVFIAEWVEK
jgi:TolB protein